MIPIVHRGRGLGATQSAFHRAAIVIVAVIAAALVWSVGFKGFMPLDQAIVWDGGWRLLDGQAPYADFLLPAGLAPSAIQALVFALGGVSWTSYVAHAAAANAVFAVAVYVTLARLFARPGPPFFYALLSGAALYPPMGTPYPDQHALLFGALLFMILLWDAGSRRASALRWFLLPVVAAVAFLSKPMPSGWMILCAGLMFLVIVLRWRHSSAVAWIGLALGMLVVVLVGVMSLRATSFADTWLSLVTLPRETGLARLTGAWIAPRLHDVGKPGLIAIVLALVFCWRALLGLRSGTTATAWAAHATATSLVAGAVVYACLTDNSPWFGFGALPLAAGLTHFLVEQRLQRFPGLRGRLAWAIGGMMAIQVGVLHLDTSMTRAANELRRARWIAAVDGAVVDPRLAGLRWVLPPMVARDLQAEDSAQTYRDLLNLLRGREGNFVLIGDATILHALAGKPSVFPALWFHPGLTYPERDHPARARFDAKIVRALVRYDARRVVIDGDRTWTGARVTDFAPLAACLAQATEVTPVGRFRVVELPPGCVSR